MSKFFFIVFILNILTINSFSAKNTEKDNSRLIENINNLLSLSESTKNNHPEKSLSFAKKAYKISENSNYDKGKVNSMLQIAEAYMSMQNYKMAIEYVEKSKKIASELKLQKELAKAYRISGIIFTNLENYTKSSNAFYRSLKIHDEIGDKMGVGEALGDIGNVYFSQLNFDKALEYFNRSLKIAKKYKNIKEIARELNNVATIYFTIEDYDKATKYFEESRQINKRLGNKQQEAINNLNLGLTYLKINEYTKSKQYLIYADSLNKKLNNVNMEIKCWLGFSYYYITVNKENDGIKYAKKALLKAKIIDNKLYICEAADILHNTYLNQKDTFIAYKYLNLLYITEDSLNYAENKLNLTKLELEYEFEKKEQKEKLEQQKSKLFILLIIIILLVIVIVIVLVLVIQRIKTKNAVIKQQKLEHKLEIQNKEMTTNVMSLMKKNEILSIMSNKLVEIKNKAVNKEVKNSVSKIADELQKTTNAEIDKEFEYRLNQIHVGFYDKLLEKYPDITPGELRLSAFLRLNMSTKDISELTGQVPNSIETARYRLRKKLGISNTKENLIIFLSKI